MWSAIITSHEIRIKILELTFDQEQIKITFIN